MLRPGSTPVMRAAVLAPCGTLASEPRGEGRGESFRGYALARSDAGEVREDLGSVDVLFVHGRAEGVDVGDGDDEGGCVGEGRLVVGGAFDRAPPRPVGLDQDDVGEPGQVADPPWVDAAYPVLGEHPGAGHDRGGFREGFFGLRAQFVFVF